MYSSFAAFCGGLYNVPLPNLSSSTSDSDAAELYRIYPKTLCHNGRRCPGHRDSDKVQKVIVSLLMFVVECELFPGLDY